MDETTPAFKMDGPEPPTPVEVPGPVPASLELELFDDLYQSSVINFKLEPNIRLANIRSVVLYALGDNSEAIHIAYTKTAAQARKFMTLNAGGSVSISAPDSKEHFTLLAWVKNATSTATQGLYIFGLRRSLRVSVVR